jgi:hypothetical protein
MCAATTIGAKSAGFHSGPRPEPDAAATIGSMVAEAASDGDSALSNPPSDVCAWTARHDA